ncbi:hypothetical protein ACFLZ0_01310 [Patescibacteria group bacterium]
MDLSKVKKYEQLDFDQWVAVGNKLGGLSNVKMVLRDELDIETRKVAKMLFDKYNRWDPINLEFDVCDEDRDYRLNQPKIDTDNRIQLLHESSDIDTGITDKQFQEEYHRLWKMISGIPKIANILKRVCFPVILTKRHSDDIGRDLEWQLEGVGKSYIKTFPGRKFHNYRKGTLAGQVNIIKESGYQSIWDRKENENIIVLFFPNTLQGYSIFAQREQMAILSKFGFVLSGAIEPMIMYPDIIARDLNTPGLDLVAFSWRSADYSLRFVANDDGLNFGSRVELACARGDYSGGLFFCG